MYKLLLAAVLGAAALVAAQDSAGAKNVFGWERGLTYRRYVKHDMWIGVNVSGTYDKTGSQGSGGYTTVLTVNDSVINSSNDLKDTDVQYSGTVKIEAGKELFGYKRLHLDAYAGVGYTYGLDKTFHEQADLNSGNQPSRSVLGIVGFEPYVLLWERLSVGMQFGVQFTHTWSEYTYISRYSGPSSVQTNVNKRTTNENTVTLFGNVSLTNYLVVLFYF